MERGTENEQKNPEIKINQGSFARLQKSCLKSPDRDFSVIASNRHNVN